MSTHNNAVSFHELSKASIRLLVEKEKVLFQSSAQGNKARRYRNELRREKNDLKNKDEELAEISKERDNLKELLETVTSERDQFDRDAEKDKNSIVSFEATIKEMSAEISRLNSVIKRQMKKR